MTATTGSGPHPSLRRAAADLIGGKWLELGVPSPSTSGGIIAPNPARPAEIIWAGQPEISRIDAAVAAARDALGPWIRAGRDRRSAVLRRYQAVVKSRAQQIAELIADETGKVMWEAKGEAASLINKVDITLDDSEHGALRRVTDWQIPLAPGRTGRTMFRPHGVMAVVGPFNFPAHLPNGHIVPALALGNTVVLKPSDKAPAVGQMLGELFQEALDAEGFGGLGIVNVVQGAAPAASRLVSHDGIDGILFTGSWPVGRRILEANLDRPGRIIALEMGGNNAAVVMPDADLRQAAIEIVRCAFNTAGQRCTSTRRAIIHEAIAPRLIPAICQAASQLVIGEPRAEYPVFMGPLIREEARQAVLSAVAAMARGGGELLVEGRSLDLAGHGGWYLSPSVLRVDRFEPAAASAATDNPSQPPAGAKATGGMPSAAHQARAAGEVWDAGCDVEVFGPVLRLSVVPSLDDAIRQCNATQYGLAASIFTKDPAAADRFLIEARAGCVNINTGTAGASSKLPFGGLGHSGNHRPAGSFSVDYCAYPVGAMIEEGGAAAIAEGMRFEDTWVR